MPNLSPIEIAVVALLALVVFGPDKLPDIARTVGRTFNQLRRMADDARTEFRSGFDEPVADEPVGDEPVTDQPVATDPDTTPDDRPADGRV